MDNYCECRELIWASTTKIISQAALQTFILGHDDAQGLLARLHLDLRARRDSNRTPAGLSLLFNVIGVCTEDCPEDYRACRGEPKSCETTSTYRPRLEDEADGEVIASLLDFLALERQYLKTVRSRDVAYTPASWRHHALSRTQDSILRAWLLEDWKQRLIYSLCLSGPYRLDEVKRYVDRINPLFGFFDNACLTTVRVKVDQIDLWMDTKYDQLPDDLAIAVRSTACLIDAEEAERLGHTKEVDTGTLLLSLSFLRAKIFREGH